MGTEDFLGIKDKPPSETECEEKRIQRRSVSQEQEASMLMLICQCASALMPTCPDSI